MPHRVRRRLARAVARDAGRARAARRAGDSRALRRRGRRRARAGPAAARQRLQGAAGAQPARRDPQRPLRGSLMATTFTDAVGAAITRVEGREKVAGAAQYAFEAAREAAEAVRVDYDAQPHDVELTAEHPKLYKPDHVNPSYETDTEQG